MDLPDDIRDFFEIRYERPGRMSPGMTCTLEIIFTPRINEDIHAVLPLLAETGPISIPLICTYPKVVPSLSQSLVLFQNVVKGETSIFHLKIKNDGALPTKFAIERATSSPSSSSVGKAMDHRLDAGICVCLCLNAYMFVSLLNATAKEGMEEKKM